MSAVGQAGGRASACVQCLRRSWLLCALSASLDYSARDRERMTELLSLEDRELLLALGGRRRAELEARYEAFSPGELPSEAGVEAVCGHCPSYPAGRPDDPAAPRMLNVAGGPERLAELAGAPWVAILGSRRASDYGAQMARSLARGLAASGIPIAIFLADGIAAAALGGALELDGAVVVVRGAGLGVQCPARQRALYARGLRTGCALSELPHGCGSRRWGAVASERILARTAQLVVVVEAEERPEELALAYEARALGRTVGAMPGRLTSRLSTGAHALLIEGAQLVRGAEDALDLLHLAPATSKPAAATMHTVAAQARLEPRLARMLELVDAGADTPEKLIGRGENSAEALLALSELELCGLLARCQGGRYVACEPSPPRAS